MSPEQVAAAAQPFKLFKSTEIDSALKALDENPAENRIYESKAIPVQINLIVEKHKSGTEFEWHEGRDHVIQIIDGSTLYELGGTPKGIRQFAPGDWRSTSAEGTKSLLLGKGDMLVIPRGMLHRRSTEDSVTMTLIANPAPAKA